MSRSLSTLIRHQNTTKSNHIWIKIIIIYWPSITIFYAITFTIFPKDNKAKGTFLLKKSNFTFSQLWLASYCLLTFSQQDAFLELLQVSDRLFFNVDSTFVQLYHGENKLFSMKWWWGPRCTRPTRLVGLFIVLARWNNSPRIEMSPHSDILSWFRDKQSLLFLLSAACLADKQQIPIL